METQSVAKHEAIPQGSAAFRSPRGGRRRGDFSSAAALHCKQAKDAAPGILPAEARKSQDQAQSLPQAQVASAPSLDRLLYRINDACILLGLSRSSLYLLAAEGKLKIVRIAGRSVVTAESITDLVNTL